MKRFCFALDLVNDREAIAAYEEHHRRVQPVIIESIRSAGITGMDLYRVQNRLFMIMETTDDFSFEQKEMMDMKNPLVQEWENLMWTYQQPLPGTASGVKWVLMDQIFSLEKCP